MSACGTHRWLCLLALLLAVNASLRCPAPAPRRRARATLAIRLAPAGELPGDADPLVPNVAILPDAASRREDQSAGPWSAPSSDSPIQVRGALTLLPVRSDLPLYLCLQSWLL